MTLYYSVKISKAIDTTKGRRYRRLEREFSSMAAARKFYDEHEKEACYADLVEFNGSGAGRFIKLKTIGK